MWRTWHKLFGWHYILLHTPSNNYRYVERIRKLADGRMYVEFGGIVVLYPNGTTSILYLWEPLTWVKKQENNNE